MIGSITVNELKEKLDNKEEIILIDCREQGEWDEGHIDSAKLIPLSEFGSKYESELKDKGATIIMQCRSGKRSLNACQLLMAEDYENLLNLEGGILAWENAGFDVKK